MIVIQQQIQRSVYISLVLSCFNTVNSLVPRLSPPRKSLGTRLCDGMFVELLLRPVDSNAVYLIVIAGSEFSRVDSPDF